MNEKVVLEIIEKFNASSITELDYKNEGAHIILRKMSEGHDASVNKSYAAPKPGANNSSGQNNTQEHIPTHLSMPAAALQESGVSGEKITSPVVATFYASPSPDAPPFVQPGTKVKAGGTLCILEAMKMMNHLEAEFDCEVVKTHAATGDLVEYGQELFTVKRL